MAIAMVALMAFSALVIDYGLFWVSRRQAQNAADAAALAGAQSLAFEDTANFGPTGLALGAARAAALANTVWGQPVDVRLGGDGGDSDVAVVNCPDLTVNNCMKVDVVRTQERGNPLPTFFARLAGVDTQDVRGTATAEALIASTSDTVRPWAVADRWDEVTPGGIQAPAWDPDWTPTSTYTRGVDVYGEPTTTTPGTSYRIYDDAGRPCCDYGRVLALRQRAAAGPPDFPASWYQEIRFPGMDDSYSDWVDAIMDGHTATIGSSLTVGPAVGYRFSGDAVHHLIERDPDAFWYNPHPDVLRPWLDTYDPNGVPVPDGLDERCPEGCVYSPATGINASPRIGAIAIVSPEDLADCPGGCSVTVRNVIGFFVDRETDLVGGLPQVYGRLVRTPGRVTGRGLPVHQTVAALRQIVLVK
jgi:Flp pilus assembly protein TadG